VPVESGGRTLKDAINEALRDWSASFEDTHYLLGTAAGPHPFPTMVREFQRVIGKEARAQILEAEGRLPDAVLACVGGGSNAIGLFRAFVSDAEVALLGFEAGGRGSGLGDNAASIAFGRPGVLHGCYSQLLQDADGQVQETHSVSAGLDYPAVGPEHALLALTGRVRYEAVGDDEALAALAECCAAEGILPALESAHALAGARRWTRANPGRQVLVCVSGRGDKDLQTLESRLLAGEPGTA
jgi:tryptophan synthase beta chain